MIDRLTFGERRVTSTSVKRALKKLIVFGLVALFIYGAWCASMAGLGPSVASAAQGCPQDSSPLEKTPAAHSTYSCPFGSSFSLLPKVSFASLRIHFFKDSGFPVAGTGSSDVFCLSAAGAGAASSLFAAQKVSLHLFHSVLTL